MEYSTVTADESGNETYDKRIKKLYVSWPPKNPNSELRVKENWVSSMFNADENRKGLKQVVWPPPPEESEYITNGDNSVQPQVGQYQSPSPTLQKSPSHQPPSPQPYSQPNQPKTWSPVAPQYQPHPTQAFRPVQPPPATITLRASPPISQAPAPVYNSQPAATSLRGGINMRGDQKWPPASVKAQVEQENEQRMQLAKGPAFRPRKVKKDYSTFFAQHALNSTYPGYRAPPGTQHYTEEQPGVSNF